MKWRHDQGRGKEMAMCDTNDQNRIAKEDIRFLTDGEILELDGVLLKTNEEVIKKAGEISEILRTKDDLVRKLRDAYLSAAKALKEKDALLEEKGRKLSEEVQTRWNLKSAYDLLQQKYEKLETDHNDVKAKLERASQRTQELGMQLSAKEQRCLKLESDSKQIQKDCSQYYTDARADKERAEADLRQIQTELTEARQKAAALQERLEIERKDRDEKEKEIKELGDRLQAETARGDILDEKVQQYASREQKMPAVTRMCRAYSSMVERRGELPEAFYERLQSVVPLDGFDSFLIRVMKPSFPISYYLSVQSFVTVYSHSGQLSGEGLKEALRVSDELLAAVFDFGSEYFKEEKLVRLDCKAGDSFNGNVCKYIDGKGGLYGNIVKVWLQGFRDEKNNKIYCSYVEGE